jgi:putative DNA primase/helicase
MGVSTNPDDYFPDDLDSELKIRVALSVIPSDDYEVWFRVGAAIHAALGDDGYAVFDEWSRESPKYEQRACQRKWRECTKMRSIGMGTIFRYADQHDRRWRALYRRLLTGEVAA